MFLLSVVVGGLSALILHGTDLTMPERLVAFVATSIGSWIGLEILSFIFDDDETDASVLYDGEYGTFSENEENEEENASERESDDDGETQEESPSEDSQSDSNEDSDIHSEHPLLPLDIESLTPLGKVGTVTETDKASYARVFADATPDAQCSFSFFRELITHREEGSVTEQEIEKLFKLAIQGYSFIVDLIFLQDPSFSKRWAQIDGTCNKCIENYHEKMSDIETRVNFLPVPPSKFIVNYKMSLVTPREPGGYEGHRTQVDKFNRETKFRLAQYWYSTKGYDDPLVGKTSSISNSLQSCYQACTQCVGENAPYFSASLINLPMLSEFK